MPGGAFAGVATNITLANQAATLIFVNPPAAPNIDLLIHRVWVSQSNAAMASVNMRVQLNTQVTAFPTLTGATPVKLSTASAASVITTGTSGAAGTLGINASAEGAGAKTVIWPDAFNSVNGWQLILTPDEYLEMAAGSSSGLGLHFPVAAGTLTAWHAGISWIED